MVSSLLPSWLGGQAQPLLSLCPWTGHHGPSVTYPVNLLFWLNRLSQCLWACFPTKLIPVSQKQWGLIWYLKLFWNFSSVTKVYLQSDPATEQVCWWKVQTQDYEQCTTCLWPNCLWCWAVISCELIIMDLFIHSNWKVGLISWLLPNARQLDYRNFQRKPPHPI